MSEEGVTHSLQTLIAAVKIFSSQSDTSPRYSNSVLGDHKSSVTCSSQDCNLTFTSTATSWPGQQFNATTAQSISDEGDYTIFYQARDDEMTLVVM